MAMTFKKMVPKWLASIIWCIASLHGGPLAAQPPESPIRGAPAIPDSAKQAIRNHWSAHDAGTTVAKQTQPMLSREATSAIEELNTCLATSASTSKVSADITRRADDVLAGCSGQQAQLKRSLPESTYTAVMSQTKSTITRKLNIKPSVALP
jgi:hypothetical protein